MLSVFISSDTDSVMSAKKFERVTAGAEANVAVTVSRLGLKSSFFSRFGNDQLGSVMLADIQAEGVDVSLTKRVDSFTAAMVRNPGQTAPVEISYLRKGSAASTIEPADILDSYLSDTRWLHTTGITCAISQSGAATVKHALTKAASLGIKASFDLIFISISPVLPVFNRIMQILSVRTTHYFLSVGNMKRIYWK